MEFLNSDWHDVHGRLHEERLEDRAWLDGFLDRWDLVRFLGAEEPPVPALKELRRAVREGVEQIVAGEAPGESVRAELERRLRAAPMVHRLHAVGDAWEVAVDPVHRGPEALLGSLALGAARFFVEIDPARLRICSNDACGWVFYDETRNRSRRWCASTSCGNIAKVRRYRERQKQRADG